MDIFEQHNDNGKYALKNVAHLYNTIDRFLNQYPQTISKNKISLYFQSLCPNRWLAKLLINKYNFLHNINI